MLFHYNPTDKENRKTLVWLTVLFIAIVWSAFTAPLSFVLQYKVEEHDLWWDGIICGIFTIDIYLRLTNKLKLPEDQLITTDPNQKPKKPYYKTVWFVTDIFTSIPFDILVAFLGLAAPVKLLALIRLAKVVRIVKLRSVLSIADFLPKLVKVVIGVTGVILAIHLIACGWMLISPQPQLDTYSYYNVSLYWAVTTLTTVGYGDIAPNTNIGRIYTMGVMLIGVASYGIIIGNFSRMIMLADKYKEEKKEKMTNLNHFLRYYNIPTSLQKQVFSFYNHLLSKNISEEDSKIVNDLPQALQNELQLYMKIKLIKNVHIFKECSTPCLKMIATKLEQTFHSPNEYIIQKGSIGDAMYIIGHGEVEVSVGEKIVAELKVGQFFGEIALLQDTIRNADIKTKAYCDLYTFKKEDFIEVIAKYPSLQEKLSNIYNKRKSDSVSQPPKQNAA